MLQAFILILLQIGWLIFISLLFISIFFNGYMLFSFFSKGDTEGKSSIIGLAAILPLLLILLSLKHILWWAVSMEMQLLYGGFTGMMWGIYRQGKKYDNGDAGSSSIASLDSAGHQSSFSIALWLRSTAALLMYILLGTACMYAGRELLIFLYQHSAFFSVG